MKTARILLFCLLTVSMMSSAQTKVWVQLQEGNALSLDPLTMSWEPVAAKQQISARTYVLTKESARLKVFLETDVLEAPPGAQFFISDLFPRDRISLVEELTSIELQHLPPSSKSDSSAAHRRVGVTYGRSAVSGGGNSHIPHLSERIRAAEWLRKHGQPGPALLSLKRTLTTFPVLYERADLTGALFELYDTLELHGFLYEETKRLMAYRNSDEFSRMILQWNDVAKTKLTQRD